MAEDRLSDLVIDEKLVLNQVPLKTTSVTTYKSNSMAHCELSFTPKHSSIDGGVCKNILPNSVPIIIHHHTYHGMKPHFSHSGHHKMVAFLHVI